MDLDLTGKHALVCGASEGIGRAAARELALLGADVTLLARRPDVLETLAQELPRKDGQHHGWIAADVLDTDHLRAQVQALVTNKPVHILVNNTGGPPGGPVHAAQSDAFEVAFRQHLLANQALAQSVLPGMRVAHFGRIVNVISTSPANMHWCAAPRKASAARPRANSRCSAPTSRCSRVAPTCSKPSRRSCRTRTGNITAGSLPTCSTPITCARRCRRWSPTSPCTSS